jgi:uncharacterized radical SAM protein YgiQ
MAALGWTECDVIIVSGDAYVDHASFGPAVISRVLLAAGYRVGIIPQPRWNDATDIARLGRPRLFFGVTAGNVDSMVANHSPSLGPRRVDDYSPAGEAGLRPDRATIVYCNLLRHAFAGTPFVIGGIEASLRRLAHYDYWSDSVRRSLLLDTRADILVYGMGEAAILEIAGRISSLDPSNPGPLGLSLSAIPGTAINSKEPPPEPRVLVPSFEKVSTDKTAFNEAFKLWHRESDNPQGKPIVQPHADRFVVQYPPQPPLSTAELDRIYDLPYSRLPHPSYAEPIPALETVKFSITSHRGCLGSCSFCSLGAHQGRIIQSRSRESVLREAALITRVPGFKGHITDIGGPSANMYAATCGRMKRGTVCPDRECTHPRRCPNLRLAIRDELDLLAAVRRLPGVSKVSVGTGIRYDLLDDEAGLRYTDELCRYYVSGQLRVAPEHVSDPVLSAMHKGRHKTYVDFRKRFSETNKRLGRKQYLIPYFISGHPGATVDDAVVLAEYLVRVERFFIRQVQQFTPLPMTAAAGAWHTGKDPLTGKELHVARDPKEQKLQRCLLQLQDRLNFEYALRELSRLGRRDLFGRLLALKPLLGTHIDSPRRRPILKAKRRKD